jgi:hypothetical protein
VSIIKQCHTAPAPCNKCVHNNQNIFGNTITPALLHVKPWEHFHRSGMARDQEVVMCRKVQRSRMTSRQSILSSCKYEEVMSNIPVSSVAISHDNSKIRAFTAMKCHNGTTESLHKNCVTLLFRCPLYLINYTSCCLYTIPHLAKQQTMGDVLSHHEPTNEMLNGTCLTTVWSQHKRVQSLFPEKHPDKCKLEVKKVS